MCTSVLIILGKFSTQKSDFEESLAKTRDTTSWEARWISQQANYDSNFRAKQFFQGRIRGEE